MFGVPVPLSVIVGVVALIGGGGAYVKGRFDGADAEAVKWERKIDEQKAEAAALLAAETEKVLVKERELAALVNKSETDHATALATIAADRAKYDRLGKLYVTVKGRWESCDAAGRNDSGGPGMDSDRAGSRVELPDAVTTNLRTLAADAERMRQSFMGCRDYVRQLLALVNN